VVEGNVAYGLAGGVAGTSLSSAGASLKGVQRWPGEFGQRAKWIFCLMTARIAADQERA
jgi:hypothetical protein